MTEDTADKVGTINECLYSVGNRVEIAKILLGMDRPYLLDTMLEDIARTVQDMTDEYCLIKEK